MKCLCKNEMIAVTYSNIKFLQCPNCNYLKKCKLPSDTESITRYDKHVCDDNYVLYMNKIYDEIKEYLVRNTTLDYGCGKIHLLSDILNNNGYNSSYYDLYYYNIEIPNKVDNIILIEVFEHISDPVMLLTNLKKHLTNNGRIIIKTEVVVKNLNNWWYLRDITHVSFVSFDYMKVLSNELGFDLIYDKDKSLFILKNK